MPVQSAYGPVRVFEDFLGWGASATISDATAGTRYNDLTLIALSGDAVFINTLDESGGVASFSGNNDADDGMAIVSSPLQPSTNGTITMEARFKVGSATNLRVFCGWQETVDTGEPVNPFTLSGTTLTSNNGGNAVGFYADSGATTDDFRFHASLDGTELTTAAVHVGDSVAASNSGVTTLGALGVRAGVTLTADSWYIARVTIFPDGTAEGWFGHESMVNAKSPVLVARLTQKDTLDETALYYPILILSAEAAGDPLFECDYFAFQGGRDWAA